MLLPSKELLSEVLGFECSSYKEIGDDNIIYPLVHYGWVKGIEQLVNSKQYPKGINIYELAHKCKEWAFNKDKYKWLFSYRAFVECYCDIVDNHNRKNIFISFAGKTEPEAILKACEWIMEETK